MEKLKTKTSVLMQRFRSRYQKQNMFEKLKFGVYDAVANFNIGRK